MPESFISGPIGKTLVDGERYSKYSRGMPLPDLILCRTLILGIPTMYAVLFHGLFSPRLSAWCVLIRQIQEFLAMGKVFRVNPSHSLAEVPCRWQRNYAQGNSRIQQIDWHTQREREKERHSITA